MMPMRGELNYNDYTFNATVRTTLSSKPMYARDGRTVTHVEYVLNVRWYIYNDASRAPGDQTCKEQMLNARRRLSSAGKKLIYKDFGFYDVKVGGDVDSPSHVEIMWGPKPTNVEYRLWGFDQVWELSWSCTFAISECSSLNLHPFSIMEFNYGVNWSYDDLGLCTRTYSGYVRIPTYIKNGEWNNADLIREQLKVPVPIGFRRTARDFDLSDDRSTLTFKIADTEMKLQEGVSGCVHATGSYEVWNNGPNNTNNWSGRISASYIVSPDVSRRVSWEAFWDLCVDRIKHAKKAGPEGNQVQPLLISLRIVEGLYENNLTMTYELTWTFTSTINFILKTAGVWRLLPGTNSITWRNSLGNILGNRGLSQLKFQGNEDVIINLCETVYPAIPPDGQGVMRAIPPEEKEEVKLKTEGYLSYDNAIDFHIDSGYEESSLLSQSDQRFWRGMEVKRDMEIDGSSPTGTPAAPNVNPYGPSPGDPGYYTQPPYRPLQPSQTDLHSIQARRAPVTRVHLRGMAHRAGVPSAPPTLEKIGNRVAVPIGEQWLSQRQVGVCLGVPIFRTSWHLVYTLTDDLRGDNRVPLFGLGVDSPEPADFVNEAVAPVKVPDVFMVPADPRS